MAQPKKLTKKQKECVAAHGLNPDGWLYVSESEFYYKLIHRTVNKVIRLCKYKSVREKGVKRK